MCSEPAIRAPCSGRASAYSRRSSIRPGISCSASRISLRPNSASARSATAKSMPLRVCSRPVGIGRGVGSAVMAVHASWSGLRRAALVRNPHRSRTDGLPESGRRPWCNGPAAERGGPYWPAAAPLDRGRARLRRRAMPVRRRPSHPTGDRPDVPARGASWTRSAQQVVAQQRLGGGGAPVRGQQPGRGDGEVGVDRHRHPARGRPRAPGPPAAWRRTARQPARGSGCRNTPPVSTTSPSPAAGVRHRPRRCRRTASTRGQRGDPAVLRRAARVPGHVADLGGHPLRRSGASRSASTGSTTPSAWPSTSTPAAAARTPRSPSTVRRAGSSGRPARVHVGGRGADVDDQHPAPAIRASSHRGPAAPRPGSPPAPAGGTAARPPGRARRARGARSSSATAARAGPGTTSPRRGATLSQATTVRPVDRSSASASSRAAALPASTIG